MKKILLSLQQTLLTFLLIFLSFNIYFIIVSLISAKLGFFKEYLEKYFLPAGSFLLTHLEFFIILLLAVILCKIWLQKRYGTSKSLTWQLSFKVYGAIIMQIIFLYASMALIIFFVSLKEGVEFLKQVETFTTGKSAIYIIILALPIYLIYATVINIAMVHFFVPNPRDKKRFKIKIQDVKSSFLFSLNLPFVYLIWVVISPKCFTLFSEILIELFKAPIT